MAAGPSKDAPKITKIRTEAAVESFNETETHGVVA
jgi:hypothetical protein